MRTNQPVKHTIALIGMRGAGKTTIGRLLADHLSGPFLDTDERVVQRAGVTISTLFATQGEDEFRRLEREAVAEALIQRPAVLALGGGAILRCDTASEIRSACTTIWLTATVEELYRRILADAETPSSRPDLTLDGGLGELQRLIQLRSPTYAALADFTIETTARSPNQIARAIIEWMSERADLVR